MTSPPSALTPSPPPPRPSVQEAPSPPPGEAAPGPDASPRPALLLGLLVLAVLVPRALLFPLNENLYGDAVVRTELAERWARAPHWMSAYGDGPYQFGPLHLYLTGLVLKALPVAREDAGRLVGLVFGTLSVLPLFSLARGLFGLRAGLWAAAGLALWGMHLQFSTTAASEALALFLVLCCAAGVARALDENRFGPLVLAALALNLACATRYDAWLLVPLLSLLLALHGQDRVAGVTRALAFGLLCLPFPLLWMQGNEVAHGDPLYPLKEVERFHAAWVADGVGRYGEALYRLHNLVFWPAAALFTLSPGIAALGALGMVRAWRTRPDVRWLVLLALVPGVLYTFRAAVLLDFVPLARFTTGQLALLLPFVGVGLAALPPRWRGAAGGATLLVALALPAWLGAYTFRNDSRWASSLRPVSPTSTNPVPLMQVARFLREEVAARGGAAVIDEAPDYLDLQLAFFSGLPEERLARRRWDTFQRRLREARPGVLVRFEGGRLAQDPEVRLEGRTLVLDGAVYEALDGFAPPLHVYRRREGPAPPGPPGG